MSVTRVGATKKFADNWEHIFGGRKRSAPSKPKSAKKKAAAKKASSRGKKKSRPGR